MTRSMGVYFVVALLFATAAQAQPAWNGGRRGDMPGHIGNPGFTQPRGYPYGRPGGLPGLVPGLVLGLGLIPFLQPAPPVVVAPGGYPQPPARAGSPPGYPPPGTPPRR